MSEQETTLTDAEREALTDALASAPAGCWDHEACCWSSFEAMVPAVERIKADAVAVACLRAPGEPDHEPCAKQVEHYRRMVETERDAVATLTAERDEWRDAANKFCDDYHAELDRRIDAVAALDRVKALAENPSAAMDLWWTTTGDDWAVRDDLPAAFLRAALDGAK